MHHLHVRLLAATMVVTGTSAEAAPSARAAAPARTANGAANPAYVGTWAIDPASCKIPQDSQGAPMILRRNRYDQHEAHCAFKSVRRSSNAWWVSAQCVAEGSKQRDRFTLRVKGDTLIMAHGNIGITMKRCK